MSRYFFNVHDGEQFIDTVGSELPDLESVHAEALETASQLLRSAGPHLWSGQDWTMNVLDGAGQEVLTLRFSACNKERFYRSALSDTALADQTSRTSKPDSRFL